MDHLSYIYFLLQKLNFLYKKKKKKKHANELNDFMQFKVLIRDKCYSNSKLRRLYCHNLLALLEILANNVTLQSF